MIALKWIGAEGQFVAGIPAADHQVETEAEAAALVAGGLYEAVKPAKPTKLLPQNELLPEPEEE